MNELCEAQKLIHSSQLYFLKATIDLQNTHIALKLLVPGLNNSKERIFTLSQSSEVIISILCGEIPYVISDLLAVVQVPIFYKGCLAMEVNGELTLLSQTIHSLQVDLSSLTRNMRLKRRVEFERLFWLKIRKNFMDIRKKNSTWCPTKESYRKYLRYIIDRKLCPHLVPTHIQNVQKRIDIINTLSKFESMLKLPASHLGSRNLAGSKHRYYSSMFMQEDAPAQRQRLQRNKEPNLLGDENWLEITCDSQIENYPSESLREIDENKNEQHNKINKRRSFSIRIFMDDTLYYWGCPILKSTDIQQQSANNNGEYQAPKVVLLGVLEDCQAYIAKLFTSVMGKGPTSFEIVKSTENVTNMEAILPEKFRNLIRDMENLLCSTEDFSISKRLESRKIIYSINLNKKIDLLNFSY